MNEIINEFIGIMQDYGFKFDIKEELTLSKDFYNNRKFKITNGNNEISISNELVEIKIQEDDETSEIKVKDEIFFIDNNNTINYKEKGHRLCIQFINEYGGTELEISFSSLN